MIIEKQYSVCVVIALTFSKCCKPSMVKFIMVSELKTLNSDPCNCKLLVYVELVRCDWLSSGREAHTLG